ncbi:class I SAM-dependent methyltransferase [bacterium]|nr:class I SAM-dependent methyltransferase [candidate division CSSED10-310 bacterium]
MNLREYNRKSWDKEVELGNPWTIPVSATTIEAARHGDIDIYLTPIRRVPLSWFPCLERAKVLCLASGGGQQGPVLAAAKAEVTVMDNSPKQLEQDRIAARKFDLDIMLIEGDMRDLSCFPDNTFDLTVHPVSNCFVDDVRKVWRETYRVLKPGGVLLSGFNNPVIYIFDQNLMEKGVLKVVHTLPYSDLTNQTEEQLFQQMERGVPLEFSHTLEDQIGGQLEAGFIITGFYEDRNKPTENEPISAIMPVYMATRAVKPMD